MVRKEGLDGTISPLFEAANKKSGVDVRRLCGYIAIAVLCSAFLSCADVGRDPNSGALTTPTASNGPSTIHASAFPTLQAAINALPASGGTLFIDGQFEATATGACLGAVSSKIASDPGPCILKRSHIRILGDGVTSKIYTTSPSTTALQVLGSDAIAISGVEFVGPWSAGKPTGSAVAVRIDAVFAQDKTTASTRVTVENCRVHNFAFDGLWARNGTAQIHFQHNESYGNAGNAIEIEAQDSSVVDNDLHDNRGQGLEIYSAAQRVSVANNRMTRDAVGIQLVNDPDYGTLSAISVVGNNADNNAQAGIEYTSTGPGVTPSGVITIKGNTAVRNRHDGISLDYAGVGITVSDNVAASNADADISVRQSSDVIVSNNILTRLPGGPKAANGILISPDSARVHVLNNATDGF